MPKKIKNDRIELWAHLVSEHSAMIDLSWTMKELTRLHDHEHKGPGTIRDHPKSDREYSMKKIGTTLSEYEDT